MNLPDPNPAPRLPKRRITRAARPHFPDPRRKTGFLPEFYPTCHGAAPPPPNTSIPHLCTQLEFLAAYYEINRAQAALAAARALPASTRRDATERRALRQVETALRRRDALEDHYAPVGVIAETTLHHGRIIDLRFTHGNVNSLGQLRAAGHLFAAYAPLHPGPNGTAQPLSYEAAWRILSQSPPPPSP